jgi:hypothetical protein
MVNVPIFSGSRSAKSIGNARAKMKKPDAGKLHRAIYFKR